MKSEGGHLGTPLFPTPRGAFLMLLALAAAFNVAANASATLLLPDRFSDLETILAWTRHWLTGHALYVPDDSTVDYPPWAIAAFAPFTLIRETWLGPAWVGIYVLLTPLLPYLTLRALFPEAPRAYAVVPVLMFSLWNGAWESLQFTRLTMAAGLCALLWSDKRPWTSGALLGFALTKPHIGGPFLLWALLRRRYRPVMGAAMVTLIGLGAYSIVVHRSPIAVVASYAGDLHLVYAGSDPVVGMTSLRGFLPSVVSTHTANVLIGSAAVVSAVFLVIVGFAERRASGTVRFSAPTLACLCSLMLLYHHTSNMVILILPAFVLLLFIDDPATYSVRRIALVGLQAVLMLQPALHAHWVLDSSSRLLTAVQHQTNRLIVTALFASVALLMRGRVWTDVSRLRRPQTTTDVV